MSYAQTVFTQVINQKSVCIVLRCCVQYVEINTEQKAFGQHQFFCFHLKKTAAESYRLLLEAYGERAPSQDTCERWFRRFKSGDFDTRQERRQGTRKTSKHSKMWNCKHCWTQMIHKQKQLTEQLGVSQ